MRRTLVVALVGAIAILALVVWRGPAAPATAAAELPVPAAWLPPAPGPALPAGPAAPAAAKWYDGGIQYSSVTNCASIIFGSPYTERNVGAFVGFYADPVAGTPSPNNVYWLHIYFAGLGNPCSGTRVYLDFKLPSSTALAIDNSTYKLRCFSQPPNGAWSEFTNSADCNQSPSNAFNPYNPNAYQVLSTDSAHGNTWPLPQGAAYEFQIPVKSTTVLSSDNFQANLWTLDGEASPWLRPQVGVYVFAAGGGGNPYFVFDNPSYITLTSTYAYNYGYLYFSGVSTSGNSYAELYDATGSTKLLEQSAPIPPSTYGYMIWVDWTPYVLTPNTTYKWRLRFERNGGGTFYSVFQTFTTLPDKQVTIGSGTPAGCTDAAIGNALAGGAKRILFDCGPLPITITVSTLRFISGGVTIDGGNKVTLSGNNSTTHFTVNNNSTLTLTRIALVNGYSNFACGSVVVQGSAHLVTNEARFINNHTTGWGGALCVQPNASANIYASQFAGNSAGSLGGGAIFNDQNASTSISFSDISGNSANGDGGGIYNAGTLFFNFNALIGNAATTGANDGRGGGLYNTGTGQAYAAASTVGGNGANYGGGISTNGSELYLTGLTIAGNWADPGGISPARFMVGGGIESTQPFATVALVNTLLAGNWPGNCSVSVQYRYFSSTSHDLDDAARCQFGGPGDLNNTNPRLGPLQLNGGRTRTYGFVGNSPAIDTGDYGNCGLTDQRGFSGPGGWRAVDGNRDGVVACDIGAFEFRPGLDLLARTFLPLIRR